MPPQKNSRRNTAKADYRDHGSRDEDPADFEKLRPEKASPAQQPKGSPSIAEKVGLPDVKARLEKYHSQIEAMRALAKRGQSAGKSP